MSLRRRQELGRGLLPRLVLPLVVLSVVLAGCGRDAAPAPTTAVVRASPTTAASPSRIRRCRIAQLRVVFFSGSAAAGTGLAGIGIGSTASDGCWLQGVPSVEFFAGGSLGEPRRIAVKLVSGPAVLFPHRPSRVILRHEAPVPSALTRYPAISAGFVITSRDFAGGTKPNSCAVVTSISFRLPGVAHRYGLSMTSLASGVPAHYHICDIRPPVGISAVVSRAVLLETVG